MNVFGRVSCVESKYYYERCEHAAAATTKCVQKHGWRLAAGRCVLGVAHHPFAIARFILILQENSSVRVPVFWVSPKSEKTYDYQHKF